jgi:alpha-tubulin suppressor-like RCC1 family protein
MTGVASIAAGSYHTCAVMPAGRIICWGQGTDGQIGNGTDFSTAWPAPVLDLLDGAQVAGGMGHTCALTSAGHVVCWGSDSNGQLGNGTTSATAVTMPVAVVGL